MIKHDTMTIFLLQYSLNITCLILDATKKVYTKEYINRDSFNVYN